jgi:hypothetical protein
MRHASPETQSMEAGIPVFVQCHVAEEAGRRRGQGDGPPREETATGDALRLHRNGRARRTRQGFQCERDVPR